MSTRWYPLYQRGNPQLRVFLPNFWMKIVEPKEKQPKNIVEFHCSMEMTQVDVGNYLKKIYNVHPVEIRTRIALGQTRKHKYVVKDDDIKIAYVVLPKDQSFTFPDLFKETEDKKQSDKYKELEKEMAKIKKADLAPGAPGWFNS